jgi:hypothetical protein
MDDTDYRYLLAAKPYGQIIVLLDRSLEIATARRLLSILLLTGGVGLVLLFLASLFLAERAIVPMRKAWERQKRFIADASHELKTPLTVIAANTDVVLGNRQETVASQDKWLGYIRSETERMSKLVNDLLNIAKLDATETEPVTQPFNLQMSSWQPACRWNHSRLNPEGPSSRRCSPISPMPETRTACSRLWAFWSTMPSNTPREKATFWSPSFGNRKREGWYSRFGIPERASPLLNPSESLNGSIVRTLPARGKQADTGWACPSPNPLWKGMAAPFPWGAHRTGKPHSPSCCPTARAMGSDPIVGSDPQ